MPDKIIHLRNLTPGAVPTTSSLGVGELAINVNDGKIYLRQSGSLGDRIQTAVTTNNVTSGSITISGSVTTTGSVFFTLTQQSQNNVVLIDTASGQLYYTASSAIGGGGSTVPGDGNQAIQFNSASVFSGSSNLKYDYVNSNIILTGSLLVTQSYISKVDYIDFVSASDQPTAAARLGWNDSDGTLALGLKGGNVELLVGEAEFAYVYNAEGTTLNKGEVVYISGSQGNRVSVKRASAANDANSAGTLGLVAESIISGQTGIVITNGVFPKLNTLGLTAGALLYLSSSAGQYTTTPPTAPLHAVRLGYVQRVSATVGSIYVKIDNGYEIGELHDVVDNTTTSSYGDLLVKSGSVWINSNRLTGSYGLTGSLTATSFTGSLFGTAATASYYQETDPIFTAKSASLATTGSNTFKGNQIITGSLTLYTGSGAGDSLLFVKNNSNSSTEIGPGVIQLNAAGQTYTLRPGFGNASSDISFPDGAFGVTMPMFVNNEAADINGNITLTTVPTASFVTASNVRGTVASASYAVTASFLPVGTYNVTASWAVSASQAVTASYVTGSVYNSSNPALSASFAANASQLNGQAASFYQNASNINAGTIGNAYLPSAINVTSVTASFTGSLTGALIGTASWAQSASNAISSQTASFLPVATYQITSSWAVSASQAITASYILASGVSGLSLNQIASGSVTASVTPTQFSVVSGSTTEFIVTGTGVTIGNVITDTHTITGSLSISGSLNATSSWAVSASQAVTASYILASGVAGLSLTQISTGSVTASVTPTQFSVISGSMTEFVVTGTGVTLGGATTDVHRVTGSLNVTGSVTATSFTGNGTNLTGMTGKIVAIATGMSNLF